MPALSPVEKDLASVRVLHDELKGLAAEDAAHGQGGKLSTP